MGNGLFYGYELGEEVEQGLYGIRTKFYLQILMLPLGGIDVKHAVRRGIKYQLRICFMTEENHEKLLKSETDKI